MTFDDLDFGRHPNWGGESIQARVSFDNGYGASVVSSPYSYGGPEGLYELAVCTKHGLCYDTPITSDVEGHLSPEDVTALLARIEALPAREEEAA